MYSAFLGVLLAAIAIFDGLCLKGRGDTALGVGMVALALGLAACFVALIAGVRWALSVCRIATMAASAVMLANLSWELLLVARRPEWRLPAARHAKQVLDALFEPRPLMFLGGFAACAVILALLLGPAVRRHFTRP